MYTVFNFIRICGKCQEIVTNHFTITGFYQEEGLKSNKMRRITQFLPLDFPARAGYNNNNFILLKAVRRTNGCGLCAQERAAAEKRDASGLARTRFLPPLSAGANPRRAAPRYQRDERRRKAQSGWNRGANRRFIPVVRGWSVFIFPFQAFSIMKRGVVT